MECYYYCTPLFRGLSCFNQNKLQSIQNMLASTVTNHRKYDHVTPSPNSSTDCLQITAVCSKLQHWNINCYTLLFLAILEHTCLLTIAPTLPGPGHHYLTIPPCHSSLYKSAKHFGLSFAFDASKIWLDLPYDVRIATSVASFRKSSKFTFPP